MHAFVVNTLSLSVLLCLPLSLSHIHRLSPTLSLPLSLYLSSLSYLSLSPGLAVLQRILDTAAERGWQVTSVNLDVVTELAFVKLLSDLDFKREFQIIIDCELERLNYILNLVKKYNQSINLVLNFARSVSHNHWSQFSSSSSSSCALSPDQSLSKVLNDLEVCDCWPEAKASMGKSFAAAEPPAG